MKCLCESEQGRASPYMEATHSRLFWLIKTLISSSPYNRPDYMCSRSHFWPIAYIYRCWGEPSGKFLSPNLACLLLIFEHKPHVNEDKQK